jgi:hypothetical protein
MKMPVDSRQYSDGRRVVALPSASVNAQSLVPLDRCKPQGPAPLYQRVFVLAPIVLVELARVAGDVTLQQRAMAFAGSLHFSQIPGVATI